MSQLSRTLAICCCLLNPWCNGCFAEEAPQAVETIPAQEIGRKYQIEGEFGPLFSDVTIKGVVVDPPLKRYKEEDEKTVWLDITEAKGRALDPIRTQVKVYTDSKFSVGAKVELVVREEGKLWKAEGTDAMISSPDRSHIGKVFCVLSLHQRQVVAIAPAK